MSPPWTRCDAAAAVADLTVDSEDDIDGAVVALDCGICFLPLIEPPLFQCAGGHVICAPCLDMLGVSPDRCHVCRGKTAVRGSRRGHGRDVWPAYYDPRARVGAALGPCRCPDRGCGLLGSTAELLCHITDVHGWPCVTGVFSGDRVAMRLQEGINIIVADRGSDGTTAGRYLVVMEMAPEPFGWTVAAFCLRPRVADGPSFWPSDRTRCQISLTYVRNVFVDDDLIQHYEEMTDLDVLCTNLFGGYPDLDDCFAAHVFRSVNAAGDEDGVDVTVSIVIK